MMTVEPPVVQPSLGEMALMHGTAEAGYRPFKRGQMCSCHKTTNVVP